MKLIGWSGVAFGIGIFAVTWLILSRRTSKELSFAFEITERAFEKTLATYLDIAKFILGLAADGIVLVIGSSALGQTKQLPAGYAPPLFLLAMCIFYGIVFMPLLTLNYESFKNKGICIQSSAIHREPRPRLFVTGMFLRRIRAASLGRGRQLAT